MTILSGLHKSNYQQIARAYNPLLLTRRYTTRWLALCCLLITLAVNPIHAHAQGLIFEHGFEFSTAPVAADWQLLYGYDSGGISRDQEGVVGIETDASGNVYSLHDRRYGDDFSGRSFTLLTVSSNGTLTDTLHLRFPRNAYLSGFKRTRDGNFLFMYEEDQLMKVSPAGTLIWVRELERDPYAFGGLTIRAIGDDSANNVYFAGTFSPSESNAERGYVAKLDADGNGLWMRSWENDSFFEGTGLTVTDNGNTFVTDRIPGITEVDTRRVVFGFATDGSAISQVSLLQDTSSGPIAAVQYLMPIAEGAGVTIIGFRNLSLDGDVATLVYRTVFDASLQLVENTGIRLESENNLFPVSRVTPPSRSPDGSVRIGVGGSNGYGAVSLSAGAASALVIEKTDGTSPYINDEDFQVYVASGSNNELYIGGTSEQPGTVRVTPIASDTVDVPLRIEITRYPVSNDTLVVLTDALTFHAAGADEDGVVNEPGDGDSDALIIKAPNQ